MHITFKMHSVISLQQPAYLLKVSIVGSNVLHLTCSAQACHCPLQNQLRGIKSACTIPFSILISALHTRVPIIVNYCCPAGCVFEINENPRLREHYYCIRDPSQAESMKKILQRNGSLNLHESIEGKNLVGKTGRELRVCQTQGC